MKEGKGILRKKMKRKRESSLTYFRKKHHILTLSPKKTGGVGRGVGRKQSRTRERDFEKDSGRWKKRPSLKRQTVFWWLLMNRLYPKVACVFPW